eukprot:scaffold42852_cov29-Tisochrysis_lutea.AAC.6
MACISRYYVPEREKRPLVTNTNIPIPVACLGLKHFDVVGGMNIEHRGAHYLMSSAAASCCSRFNNLRGTYE